MGMLVAVSAADAETLVALLQSEGETAAIVGKLRPRAGDPVTFDGKLAL
jgi:phosphoribosylformylglycinamidine cyclo-ligase